MTTTCPTCGRPVAENQRFCGNCGTDVQAATAYRSSQASPAGGAGPGAPAPSFGYEPGGFDYSLPFGRRPSAWIVGLIVAILALICLCCGFVLGAGAMYWLGPVPSSGATPVPTPEGLNLLLVLLQV